MEKIIDVWDTRENLGLIKNNTEVRDERMTGYRTYIRNSSRDFKERQ